MRIVLYSYALAAASLLAACGGARSNFASPSAKTRVTIIAIDPRIGRAAFHLACRPTGGDVPSPEKACAALEKRPEIVTKPEGPVCFGVVGSGWHVKISGRIDGRPFHSRLQLACWTSGMPLSKAGIWGELEKHMLPLRRVKVTGPIEKTYASGELQSADVIACDVRRKQLELSVPVAGRTDWYSRLNRFGATVAPLEVSHHRDGSVSVSCRWPGPEIAPPRLDSVQTNR